ncbi:calcium-dependent protein kinase 4-like [Oratosquilla oratoria]|uniref:calcium-dependent protein kinase 4-like n=1 Tax=Oratosquilla oratoria TaxID=337810 RepID=UPI003F767038
MIKLRHFYACIRSLFTCCVKGDGRQELNESAPRPAQDVPVLTKKSKVKTPQDPRPIYNEITALSTLDHLNIIKLVDVVNDRGCQIIITEYCSGGTLLAAMERHVKSPSFAWGRRIISYFRQLVSAVSYMHSNHFVHLDLKAENVVVSADSKVVKVIDFGLSTRASKVYQRTMKSVRGTPWYMAPEVLDRAQHPYAGGMADVWALGCLLYELCNDCLPYFEPRIGRLRKKKQMRHYVACWTLAVSSPRGDLWSWSDLSRLNDL